MSVARRHDLSAVPEAARHQLPVDEGEHPFLEEVEQSGWSGLRLPECFVGLRAILELYHHEFAVANKKWARTVSRVACAVWLFAHLNKQIVCDHRHLVENSGGGFGGREVAHITKAEDVCVLVVLQCVLLYVEPASRHVCSKG